MKNISVSPELKQKVPGVQLSCIECDVDVQQKNSGLWAMVENKIEELANTLKVEHISKLKAIADSRKAYKTCGKDPARYRLSAEALLRRVVKRRELYQVNNVVDVLNLVSISTGFSIGGYDAAKIEGAVKFGIGKKNELYNGIGRGELNIEFMPVFRDDLGAFGTPTSDSERTAVSGNTRRFLMIIIDYGNNSEIEKATEMAVSLLKEYTNANNVEINTILS
jgi:DNA/RNA-binding domain of Phe-tRNA-synthetase-like protein